MKTKEVYKENIDRRYCPVIEIKNEGVEINSSPIKNIKQNALKISIVAVIILLIIVLTFYKNLAALGSVIGLLVFLAVAYILSNTFSMKCKEKTLQMKLNFQKFELSYERIANIYLSKDFNTTDFIPKFSYSLVIRYIDNMNFIKELSFSTLFLKAEDIKEFLDNFVIQEDAAEECIKYEKYKLSKKIFKYTCFIVFVIAIGVIAYLSLKK